MTSTTIPQPQTLWKLTNHLSQSYNSTPWGPNITHTAPGKGPLHSSGWLHAYTHPILALFMNPIHGAFPSPQLWRSSGVIEMVDVNHEHKIGTRSLTTIELVPTPFITDINRRAFAILCAQTVLDASKEWIDWAENWLSGKDRSIVSSARARDHAYDHACAHTCACACACAHGHTCACACANACAHSWLETTQAENLADLAMTIN